MDARDRSGDDQSLDLAGAFKNRVDLGGNVYFRWSKALLPNNRPTNCGSAPVSPHQRSITPRVVGEVRVSSRNFGFLRNAKSEPPNLPLAHIGTTSRPRTTAAPRSSKNRSDLRTSDAVETWARDTQRFYVRWCRCAEELLNLPSTFSSGDRHKSERASGGLGNHPSHPAVELNQSCVGVGSHPMHDVVHQKDDATHPLSKTFVSSAMKTALSEVGSAVFGRKPRSRAEIRRYILCRYIVCSGIVCRKN